MNDDMVSKNNPLTHLSSGRDLIMAPSNMTYKTQGEKGILFLSYFCKCEHNLYITKPSYFCYGLTVSPF